MQTKKRYFSPKARAFAVECWVQAKHDIGAACKRLRDYWLPGFGDEPAKASTFIRRWVRRFTGGEGFGNKTPPGRPRKLTAEQIESAANIFVGGYINLKDQQWHGWTSMAEAVRNVPDLQDIEAAARCTTDTLWRAVKAKYPGIRRYTRDYKPAFSATNLGKRVDAAAEWLRRYGLAPATWISRQVYLDEGTIDLHDATTNSRVEYALAGDPRIKTVLHLALTGGAKAIKLRFYIAVSPTEGPLFIYFTTGTTDLQRRYRANFPDPGRPFKVCVCCLHLRGGSKCSVGYQCGL